MRPLKLHIKVTLLTAAITTIVLASTVALVTHRITLLAIREQRERAELAAISLATETGRLEQPHDPDRVRRETAIVRNARTSFTAVRVYELIDNRLNETAHADGSLPASPISNADIEEIEHGEIVRNDLASPENSKVNNLFRVLVPIRASGINNIVIGAVEVDVTLQPTLATAEEFSRYLLWLVAAAIIITLGCSYLMMRAFVYLPIRRLLRAMQLAESGNLNVAIELRAPDELGVLTRGFNRMIDRLRVMTAERERQREHLAEEVNHATQELWTLTRRLSEMERLAAAGQTAAQFAHEVGTPLHIINGHVQLLKPRVDKDQKARGRLEIITEQIKRIEMIVRAMLDRTRPPQVHKEQLLLNEILQTICEATLPTIEAQGIKFERAFAAQIPPIVGDSERLQQAFLNIINNAIDATPQGGIIRVATDYQPENNETIISFADTGMGMTEDVAAHIFDPLYTTKERGRGTGLGLVIVQQVAREHNGRVTFNTAPGKGTTFQFHLPINAEVSSVAMR